MEHIPAIHAAKVGMRFPAQVSEYLVYALLLKLDLSALAPGRSPLLDGVLFVEETINQKAAETVAVGQWIEVVLVEVCPYGRELYVSLPAPLDWLTWNGGTVRALARRFCDTNDVSLFPILADALEDAGCTEAELLARCRDPHGDSLGWLAVLLATQECPVWGT